MKLLMDTQPFLFAISAPDQLGLEVRSLLEDPAVPRYVSVVSLWEIAVKVQIGKLTVGGDGAFLEWLIRAIGAEVLELGLRASLRVFALPLQHKDPFDRLLVAQAQVEGLTLATRDESMAAYGVETVW